MRRLLLVTLILICLTAFRAVEAQTISCAKAAAIGSWSWAPGSTVSVYVAAGEFTEDAIVYLLTPLTTWNAVASETGSQVTFEYKGLAEAPLNCINCLTITRGPVFDKKHRHLTELRSLNDPRQRTMLWATIVIDPRLTKHETLTNAVAHELGHSFGLLDCYSCKEKSSVMIQFKSVNTPNHMSGPTACDVAQVQSVYGAHVTRAAQKKKIVVDEGEEPVADDTPIVVPKP